MDKNTSPTLKRTFTGVVESDIQDKTIMVRVDRTAVHPKYKKRYTVSRKYPVHDPENRFSIGDNVTFVECRPLSKNKRWRAEYNGAAPSADKAEADKDSE